MALKMFSSARGQRERRGSSHNGSDGDDRIALPRFSVSASEELRDTADLGGPQSPEQARLAIADALSASQPVVAAEHLAGRHEILASLIAAIEQQRAHVVLYGERGIGKTSLIHVFSAIAADAGYVVLYGSCGVAAQFDEMFRNFAERIPQLYHASVSPTADEREHSRSFGELLGDGEVSPRELAELFSQVVGTRIILVLDEYDRVANPDFRRNVAELIKNLSDRAARVQLLLTGVASNLDELIGFTPSIRRNIVGLAVGPMPESELHDILSRAEQASGLQFEEASRNLVTRMAGGSPYLARLLGLKAAMRALEDDRMSIVPDDVMAGTEAVLAEWNAGLPRRVQAQLTTPAVQQSLGLMIAAARASGTPDGWFTASDVVAELGAGQPDDIAGQLADFTRGIDLFDRDDPTAGEARFRFRTQGLAQLLGLSAAVARAGR